MQQKAFSLVELSIVLVILGLLTGGILTGQSLIQASELRAVTTELNSFQTAINTFRAKYYALPGDMDNAEQFWNPMSTGTCPNATAGVGTETCNGIDDGIITAPNAAGQAGELYTFWQHLANAGLIEGTYTGVAGAGGVDDDEISENVPASDYGGGWNVDDEIVAADNFDLDYAGVNVFSLGADSANGDSDEPLFVPEDLWNVDKKIDDGKPGRGMVIGSDFATCSDETTDSTNLDADYLLNETGVVCAMIVMNPF